MPNIVIILADDLGYGDLGWPAIDTTHPKRMAADGVSLSSFYATAAVCSPSRAGMLTGRYPVRTMSTSPLLSTTDAMNLVMEVFGRYSYNVRGIPQDEVLLPEVLSRRGYRTGLVGKWHLGGESGYLPNDRGFDSFYGALWSNDDQPYAIYHDREVAQPAPADQDYLTRDFTNAALDFIRSKREQPFFLYLAHAMPHVPTHASPAFRGASKGGLYGDAVQELDWSVGQVLDTLKQLGLDEKTLKPVAFGPDARFDLAILAYQVWFLSPSLPTTAFLQSPAARVLRDTPVITFIVCRNMWLSAQEKVKKLLAGLGARLVDNVVLTDQGPPWSTFVTTPLWLLTGRKDALPGISRRPA